MRQFVNCQLSFVPIGVVDSEERSGERCNLAEADEQGGINLALRVDEYAAEQENQPADTHHGSGY